MLSDEQSKTHNSLMWFSVCVEEILDDCRINGGERMDIRRCEVSIFQ